MTPSDFNNDYSTMHRVAWGYTLHQQSKLPSKFNLESLLSSLLYQKHLRNLVGTALHLLGK